jgi:hypothetical protein
MADMARSFAASGDGGMGGDAGSPDMEAQDPNAPDDMPQDDGGADSLEQGIMMVEAGLAGLPGDLAEKARKMVEGLKEIAVQAQAAGGGASADDSGMDTPDGANAGSIESPSSPQVGGSAESYGT